MIDNRYLVNLDNADSHFNMAQLNTVQIQSEVSSQRYLARDTYPEMINQKHLAKLAA